MYTLEVTPRSHDKSGTYMVLQATVKGSPTKTAAKATSMVDSTYLCNRVEDISLIRHNNLPH